MVANAGILFGICMWYFCPLAAWTRQFYSTVGLWKTGLWQKCLGKHPVSNWELKSKTDGSCFNLWKSVSPLLYFLEGCTSNLIQRHIMTSQSLSLTSFFAPEVMPYSFFVGKYVHVLKLFSDESKKKKNPLYLEGIQNQVDLNPVMFQTVLGLPP